MEDITAGAAAEGLGVTGFEAMGAAEEDWHEADTGSSADESARELTDAELAAIHERNELVRAFDAALADLRQRSYEGKLTKPARWRKLSLAPAGMDAAAFEEALVDYIESSEHAVDAPVMGKVDAPRPLEVEQEGTEVDPDAPLPERPVNDIALIYGKKGIYLYSVALMSHSFAHALYLTAENDDVATFVDVVRNESRVYPRPVSENSFVNPPYLWSHAKTARVFEKATASGAFGDLAVTRTSMDEAYYYSTLYLSDAQARALAEWYGVEKGMNP